MSNFDIIDIPFLNGKTTDVPEFPGKFATDDYGNVFQLCLIKSGASIAIAPGHPAGWWSHDSTGYTVTTDLSHMAGLGSTAGCGMMMTTIGGHSATSNNIYAWVLRRGNAGLAGISTIKTDGAVSAAAVMFPISDGRWGSRQPSFAEPTSTTNHGIGRNYVAFTRITDIANSSNITSPKLVEVNGFNF